MLFEEVRRCSLGEGKGWGVPHLYLDYSSNITQSVDFRALFQEIHAAFVEVDGVPINNCKSRAVRRDDFYIGDGQEDHAFVHLQVSALAGRSPDTKTALNQALLSLLEKHYHASLSRLRLQLSVEFRDLERTSYAKVPRGTLT